MHCIDLGYKLNLKVNLDLIKKRGALPTIIEEFIEFGKKEAHLLEIYNWAKENNKEYLEAWLLSQPRYCKMLIKAGADIHVHKDYALMNAVYNGYTEVVKTLIAAGAYLDVENGGPLKLAAGYGYLEILKLLIEAGANICTAGNCPLRWAIKNEYLRVIEYLILEVGLNADSNDTATLWKNSRYINLNVMRKLVV